MQQLTAHEASFLHAETIHANSNSTFVQIYDQSTAPGGQVRFKTILAHIESRLHLSPVFRSKLLHVPLALDEPYWVEDDDFDLEYHVRHIALPRPGDWRQFCIQASRIHARALDLQRPLWEIYVIEGLDSITDLPVGSFALLTKIHHSAIDVASRNDFIEVLHDSTRRPPKPVPPEPWFPEPAPRATSLLLRAGLNLALAPTKLIDPLLRKMPKAKAFVRDVLKPEQHVSATRFNTVVSSHRVFDTRRFLISEFEQIRTLVPGASLNDAVLAVCSGGLRRYLDLQGELPETDLEGNVPHSLDSVPTAARGSAAPRRVALGTQLADARQRLARIHDQTLTSPPLKVPRLTPASCTITHVAGPPTPVYLHGARMTYFSAILPIADGMGLVFAVTRYDGRIVISPTSCRELMPNPQVFTQCVRDSFREYLALATPAEPAAPKGKALANRSAKTSANTSAKSSTARPAAQLQAPLRSARPGGSSSDRSSPSARRAETAATPLQPATAVRRRSTAPRR